jgi:hypothetical protein
LNVQATRRTVSSSTISQSPRVSRNRETSGWRRAYRKALVPARNTNAGAQKCVIQRVKKTAAEGPPAGTPEKTRTWSMAIRAMTAPRRTSIDLMRTAPLILPAQDATPRARTFVYTAAALIAFAANSLLCRGALRHTSLDAASFPRSGSPPARSCCG